MHNNIDLGKPMPGCNPLHKRQLITEVDLKFKEHNNSKVTFSIYSVINSLNSLFNNDLVNIYFLSD